MKKMLVIMCAMFVLSLSSIVSAHSIQGNWSNANYQMYAGDDQPPQPDQHKKHKPEPQPQPQPQPQQPENPHNPH